jgi:hypothetical protein
MPGLSRAFTPEPEAAGAEASASGGLGDVLRWGVALGFLVLLAVAMVIALNALSGL